MSAELSIIVPCYKDAENIEEMLRRLHQVMDKIKATFEIIYINDASPDNSEEILKELLPKYPHLRVVKHSRNFGLMNVYLLGMNKAVGQAVVLMDGDLQDPPEVIEEFYNKWKEGNLVVYGIHKKRRGSKLNEFIFASFYRVWNYLADIEIPKDAGDFCLLDKKVKDIIISLPEKDVFIRGIRAWVGFPQVGVNFIRDDRFAGVSTQNIFSYFGWALLAITSFSVKPLRVVSIFSAFSVFASILYLFVLLVMYFVGIQGPKGFMTMIGVMLLLFSANFLILSVISEYLIRIYKETKSRPTSIEEYEVKSPVES